jgi:hypothetical protein
MLWHQFRIGETVYVRPAINRNVPGGAYVVTKHSLTMGASLNIASRVQTKSMSVLCGKAN